MPSNDERRRSSHREYITACDTGERTFPTLMAEHTHDLACAVIEQAVYDWIALDYGRRGYIHTAKDNVYRAEVESFFKSNWFEYLLGFALPNIEPSVVRRELRIAEPERRVRCESC